MSFALKNFRFFCKSNYWHKTTNIFFHTKNVRLPNFHIINTKFSNCATYNHMKAFNRTKSIRLPNLIRTFKSASSTIKDAKDIPHVEEDEAKKEEKERNEQNEQSWKMMKYSFAFFGVTMGVAGMALIYEIIKPVYDEKGNLIEDEFSHLPIYQQVYKRGLKEMYYFKKFVQEPSREKLLPEPLEHPYIQPPYTLVLEMTDVLVHPDWTYQTGWRFKKRPGVDNFLETVAHPNFETVIYTAEQGLTMYPILEALDPQNCIMFKLFRDATRFVSGHHVKDLNALNRDLSKVIVIDWNSDSVKYHPENLLKIPRWTGNDDDTMLYDLAAFLNTIISTGVEDVREVLNYYRQFENPLEAFRENQRKLLSQIEEQESKLKNQDKITSKWTPSFFRR